MLFIGGWYYLAFGQMFHVEHREHYICTTWSSVNSTTPPCLPAGRLCQFTSFICLGTHPGQEGCCLICSEWHSAVVTPPVLFHQPLFGGGFVWLYRNCLTYYEWTRCYSTIGTYVPRGTLSSSVPVWWSTQFDYLINHLSFATIWIFLHQKLPSCPGLPTTGWRGISRPRPNWIVWIVVVFWSITGVFHVEHSVQEVLLQGLHIRLHHESFDLSHHQNTFTPHFNLWLINKNRWSVSHSSRPLMQRIENWAGRSTFLMINRYGKRWSHYICTTWLRVNSNTPPRRFTSFIGLGTPPFQVYQPHWLEGNVWASP